MTGFLLRLSTIGAAALLLAAPLCDLACIPEAVDGGDGEESSGSFGGPPTAALGALPNGCGSRHDSSLRHGSFEPTTQSQALSRPPPGTVR